jgi:hypothetical protein
MNVYKLRHFTTILFQIMNENDPTMKESFKKAIHAPTGAAIFNPLDKLQHYQGVKLIIKCFDRYYYVAKNNYSIGMYIAQKVEEDKVPTRVGQLP